MEATVTTHRLVSKPAWPACLLANGVSLVNRVPKALDKQATAWKRLRKSQETKRKVRRPDSVSPPQCHLPQLAATNLGIWRQVLTCWFGKGVCHFG